MPRLVNNRPTTVFVQERSPHVEARQEVEVIFAALKEAVGSLVEMTAVSRSPRTEPAVMNYFMSLRKTRDLIGKELLVFDAALELIEQKLMEI